MQTNQATHTPGPWFAGDGTNSSEEGTIYCDSEMRSAVGFACGNSRARKLANARLFASGPDLLKALQKLTRQLEEVEQAGFGCLNENPEYLAAHAAIAKAKGGAV